MEYVLGLKKEIGLLNEKQAKERYLELLAMGYSEREIIFATPVPVQVHLNVEQQTVASTEVGSNPDLNNNLNDTNGINNLNMDNDLNRSDTANNQYSDVSGLNFGGDKLPSETLS